MRLTRGREFESLQGLQTIFLLFFFSRKLIFNFLRREAFVCQSVAVFAGVDAERESACIQCTFFIN